MKRNLDLMNRYLLQETTLQQKVISQLVQLISSLRKVSKPNLTPSCDYGHAYCKINHLKYNFVRQDINSDPYAEKEYIWSTSAINTDLNGIKKTEALIKKEKDSSFIKMVIRKVDVIQSYYSPPPFPILENTNFVHEELLSIWENVFLLFSCVKFKVDRHDGNEVISERKHFRTPRMRPIPLLYYPSSTRVKRRSREWVVAPTEPEPVHQDSNGSTQNIELAPLDKIMKLAALQKIRHLMKNKILRIMLIPILQIMLDVNSQIKSLNLVLLL